MIDRTIEDWVDRLTEEIDLDLYDDMTNADTMYDIIRALQGLGWTPPEEERADSLELP